MKTQMIEFENLLETFKSKIDTKEFKKLQVDFDKSDTIFFIGNGGVHSVATTAASDVSRLPSKKCY